MTVGRGSQPIDRISKEPSKGIIARDIRNGLLVTEDNSGKIIGAYLPAKYGLDRSDTQGKEEVWVTQRVRIKNGPRTTSKTSMITDHAAAMANDPLRIQTPFSGAPPRVWDWGERRH